MKDIDSCYRLLGVQRGASSEEIKRAYHNLVREWHPDRLQHDARQQKIAEEKLKQINVAYDRLQIHVTTAASAASSPPPASEGRRRRSSPGYSASGWAGAGDFSAAREQQDEDRTALLHAEGMEHFYAGRWQEAVSALLQVVCIRPSGDVYYALGIAYQSQRLPAKAASAFRQVIRFQPGHVEAHNMLAQAYNTMGEPKEAVWVCTQLLRRQPEAFAVLITLGISYRLLRRYPQSLQAFGEALSLQPDRVEATYERGETYVASGDLTAARAVYAQLKPLHADLAAQLLLSIVSRPAEEE